jgi:L-ascorbate metabolism protein UlaG (beta-lactamase superfamily)
MRIDWYGQSAFKLVADQTLFIDPFGDMSGAAAHGITWEYPVIEGIDADLLLVTHEHADHNAVEAISGDPALIRSAAGTHETPIGTVVGIASEHDDVAGTERGANVIYVFEFGGARVAHFGDFGQSALREEQRAAIGEVDLLIVPVGGMATIDAAGAAELVTALEPKWIVPMHYRTPRINFLETADPFLEMFAHVYRLEQSGWDTESLPEPDGPLVVVPTAP